MIHQFSIFKAQFRKKKSESLAKKKQQRDKKKKSENPKESTDELDKVSNSWFVNDVCVTFLFLRLKRNNLEGDLAEKTVLADVMSYNTRKKGLKQADQVVCIFVSIDNNLFTKYEDYV
jgi:hypothetical protein